MKKRSRTVGPATESRSSGGQERGGGRGREGEVRAVLGEGRAGGGRRREISGKIAEWLP